MASTCCKNSIGMAPPKAVMILGQSITELLIDTILKFRVISEKTIYTLAFESKSISHNEMKKHLYVPRFRATAQTKRTISQYTPFKEEIEQKYQDA